MIPQPMRPVSMPQQASPMRIPIGSAPNFAIGPTPNNAQSIYGTLRRMPSPQHPGIYGAVGGAGHPMLGMQGGNLIDLQIWQNSNIN